MAKLAPQKKIPSSSSISLSLSLTSLTLAKCFWRYSSVGLAYQGKDFVFRFIIEYSSLRDFYRPLCNNRSIFYISIFERWYFGLCWNLRLVIEFIISWRILASFRGFFEHYIFCMVNHLSFYTLKWI
jgi:hypothetical protein